MPEPFSGPAPPSASLRCYQRILRHHQQACAVVSKPWAAVKEPAPAPNSQRQCQRASASIREACASIERPAPAPKSQRQCQRASASIREVCASIGRPAPSSERACAFLRAFARACTNVSDKVPSPKPLRQHQSSCTNFLTTRLWQSLHQRACALGREPALFSERVCAFIRAFVRACANPSDEVPSSRACAGACVNLHGEMPLSKACTRACANLLDEAPSGQSLRRSP